MQRDFVIQLRPDVDLSTGRFEGRVEHIDSGRSAHFHTIQDFLDFVADAIKPEAPSSDGPVDASQNLTLL
jgi:hypothetical protein